MKIKIKIPNVPLSPTLNGYAGTEIEAEITQFKTIDGVYHNTEGWDSDLVIAQDEKESKVMASIKDILGQQMTNLNVEFKS